jgi:hypothetical protein
VYYHGLAVTSKRRLFVNRVENGCGLIDAFDASGQLLASFGVPGFTSGQLCVDEQDWLYVPCARSGDVKILAPDGAMLRRIDLRGKIVPFAVAAGDHDRLWVGGQIPAGSVSVSGSGDIGYGTAAVGKARPANGLARAPAPP